MEKFVATATLARQLERERHEGTFAECMEWAAGLVDVDDLHVARILAEDDNSDLARRLRAERTIRAMNESERIWREPTAAGRAAVRQSLTGRFTA